MKKPLNFLIDDADRDKLEAYRADRGLRSLGDAIRHLIVNASLRRPPSKS